MLAGDGKQGINPCQLVDFDPRPLKFQRTDSNSRVIKNGKR